MSLLLSSSQIHVCIKKSTRILLHFWNILGFSDRSVGKEITCNGGDPSSIPGSKRSAEERIVYSLQYSQASLVAQLVKNPLAMQETLVWSLGWGDSLGEGKGYPHQYSGLENSMDCNSWWGCKQSDTTEWLSHRLYETIARFGRLWGWSLTVA